MINQTKQDSETRMSKTIDSLIVDLAKIRTGRANASLLDHIEVEYYGNPTPLTQVANITATDSRTLTVTPWEKTMVQAIEKAIMTSDLGLNPTTAGAVIRVPMPALTEERRKELIKVVRQECEQSRISIRNIRRDANNQLKDLVKDKSISEDEERRAVEFIQQTTDKFIAKVDAILIEKEKDLLQI